MIYDKRLAQMAFLPGLAMVKDRSLKGAGVKKPFWPVFILYMTELLMFEVDVKNMMEKKGRRGRRGPARVWGFDYTFLEPFQK